MAALYESVHDPICGGNAVAVMEGFEWLHHNDIGFKKIGEHEEVVAASGANREPSHVISINFLMGSVVM